MKEQKFLSEDRGWGRENGTIVNNISWVTGPALQVMPAYTFVVKRKNYK